MFEQYEKVVYPGHGVALVNRIIVKKMGSCTSSFYELKFLSQEMTFLVPTINAHTIGLRAITRAETLETVFAVLAKPTRTKDATELTAANWSRRHKEYQHKLMSGKLEDISVMYRELKHIELHKELSYGEKTLLDRAETLLAEEIAISQQTPQAKALEYIRSVFQGVFTLPLKQTSI
ncbi:MAG: CarD family transcriptional regulator [Candidatus Babeliales bacterium]